MDQGELQVLQNSGANMEGMHLYCMNFVVIFEVYMIPLILSNRTPSGTTSP